MDKQHDEILTCRVYHPDDYEQVKELFSLGITGPGSPGRESFHLSYTHHYSYGIYALLALGLWLTISSVLWSITHYFGVALVVIAIIYIVWIFIKVYAFYEGYRLASLADDLSDITGYYKLIPTSTVLPNQTGYTALTPSGFWVVEARSPQSKSTAGTIVGCVALGML
ncbi:hypothetical protein AAF712_004778 [Marasmius tenuissimus]|uniref:Uncharacterized protein n=1 Tax=Marasmius tenuissimus TaxID=585030 RepID=A0ABR3A551_9AGAR|nr:hypothetical protein PM082_007730 [Marasmius tenuissimus]